MPLMHAPTCHSQLTLSGLLPAAHNWATLLTEAVLTRPVPGIARILFLDLRAEARVLFSQSPLGTCAILSSRGALTVGEGLAWLTSFAGLWMGSRPDLLILVCIRVGQGFPRAGCAEFLSCSAPSSLPCLSRQLDLSLQADSGCQISVLLKARGWAVIAWITPRDHHLPLDLLP